MQHHKYSLTELENMIPWEKDIYVNMLIRYLEEENEKVKAANQQRRQEMAIDRTPEEQEEYYTIENFITEYIKVSREKKLKNKKK